LQHSKYISFSNTQIEAHQQTQSNNFGITNLYYEKSAYQIGENHYCLQPVINNKQQNWRKKENRKAYLRGDERQKQSEGVSVLRLRSQKERKKGSIIFPNSLVLTKSQIINSFCAFQI